MPLRFSYLVNPPVLLCEFYDLVPFPLQPIPSAKKSAQDPEAKTASFVLSFKNYFCMTNMHHKIHH